MIFKKHRRKGAVGTTDDNVKEKPFRLRSDDPGYESYHPKDYVPYEGLEEHVMIPKLDEYLSRLTAGTTALDDGNSDCLDQTIMGSVREAFSDLDRQKQDHVMLFGSLMKRHAADLVRLIREIATLKERRNALAIKYEKAAEKYNKHVEEVNE